MRNGPLHFFLCVLMWHCFGVPQINGLLGIFFPGGWERPVGESPAGHTVVWYARWALRAVCAAACLQPGEQTAHLWPLCLVLFALTPQMLSPSTTHLSSSPSTSSPRRPPHPPSPFFFVFVLMLHPVQLGNSSLKDSNSFFYPWVLFSPARQIPP